jgi:hypothetical protein
LMETILSTREKCTAKKRPNSGGEMGPPSLEGVPERAPARLGFIQERFPCQPIDLAAGAMTRARQDMLRKAMLALIAAALVGAGSVTSASAAEGMGGFGGGGAYPPAGFGSDAKGAGNCRLVAHRVKTHDGWRIRRVQVCS